MRLIIIFAIIIMFALAVTAVYFLYTYKETSVFTNSTNFTCINSTNTSCTTEITNILGEFFCYKLFPIKYYLEFSITGEDPHTAKSWYKEDEEKIYYKFDNNRLQQIEIFDKRTNKGKIYYLTDECESFDIEYFNFHPEQAGFTLAIPYTSPGLGIISGVRESEEKIINGFKCLQMENLCINQEYCLDIEYKSETSKQITKISEDFEDSVFDIERC